MKRVFPVAIDRGRVTAAGLVIVVSWRQRVLGVGMLGRGGFWAGWRWALYADLLDGLLLLEGGVWWRSVGFGERLEGAGKV